MNYYKFLFLLPLLLSGCFHDSLTDCAATEDNPSAAGEAYVTLSLSMARQDGGGTRANPNGGETGDGEEEGQPYENEISTVRIYFFERNDKGVNGPAETPVAATADFDRLYTVNGTTYNTEVRRVELERGEYDVIAVVNVVPDEGITTLGDLRDYQQKTAWTKEENGTCRKFVMASADETKSPVSIEYNTINNPTTVEIDVERHAARVDYKASGDFTCTDGDVEGAKVEIVGAALVNNLKAGTYMLKRVAGSMDDDVTYLGKETADENKVATNYVIDPWTKEKTKANEDTEKMKALYGLRYNESDKASFWDENIKEGTPLPDTETEEGQGWKIAGYTMENTTSAGNTSKLYNTGMVFKAQFHPGQLAQSLYEENATYKDGSTFFRWKGTIYVDLESIMTKFLENSEFTLDKINTSVTDYTTLTELEAYAGTLPDGDPLGYKKYLLGLKELKKDVNFTTFLRNEYGYSRTKDADGNVSVTITKLDNHTIRKLLLPFGIDVYENGLCYYTWWIRHSNDNDDSTNGKMEFAIVRNNVYKLSVESIAGIGSPVPPPDEENIKIHVYVEQWTLLPEEIMNM